MIEKLLRLLFNIKEAKFRNDDDFCDRQTRRHAVCLLLLFSLVITAKQYVGDPIQCWCPATFTDSHKSYAKSICWVQNSYYVAIQDTLNPPEEWDSDKKLSYYQWVPLILLCQATLCYIPSIIWRCLYRRSGLNVGAVMEAAIAGQRTSYSDIRDKTTRYMVHMLDKYLRSRRNRKRPTCCSSLRQRCANHCCLFYGKIYGNYLSIAYLFVKLLYILNAVGQLCLLDVFLGDGFVVYGYHVIRKFLFSEDWLESPRFPRVTMCTFGIRHLSVVHQHIVQCVLPINLFNEKIFLIVWFMFVTLCFLTCYGFIRWCCCLIYWPGQVSFVRRKLRAADAGGKREREVVVKFTQNYLRKDGVFAIRLISDNVGSLVAAEVLSGLFDNFGPEHQLLVNRGGRGVGAPPHPSALGAGRGLRINSLAEGLGEV